MEVVAAAVPVLAFIGVIVMIMLFHTSENDVTSNSEKNCEH